MSTLEEAIKRYTDNAEYERTHGNLQGCLDFRELAERLRKLKAYEEAREEIGCLPIVWREDAGVRKCIGILDKHLMEVKADDI